MSAPQLLGDTGLTDVTVLIGYFTSISMTSRRSIERHRIKVVASALMVVL